MMAIFFLSFLFLFRRYEGTHCRTEAETERVLSVQKRLRAITPQMPNLFNHLAGRVMQKLPSLGVPRLRVRCMAENRERIFVFRGPVWTQLAAPPVIV